MVEYSAVKRLSIRASGILSPEYSIDFFYSDVQLDSTIGNKNIILAVPGIAIVLSLIISTPVASEFRYGYGLFTAFPIVVFTLFYPGGKQQTSRLS